jgi:hypothetical protein
MQSDARYRPNQLKFSEGHYFSLIPQKSTYIMMRCHAILTQGTRTKSWTK